jgi:hypothetical protein
VNRQFGNEKRKFNSGKSLSLFSLTCESCASRLRVGKMSAIGQILACPKCGTMLEIKPPEGWQPPADSKLRKDQKPENRGEDSQLSGSFDDIDNILDVSQAEQAAIKQIRQLPARGSKASGAKIQNPNSPPPGGPILPTDDWTSVQTQRRKKWIAIVASVVGAILICFALVVAIISSGQKNDQPVADKKDIAPAEPLIDAGEADVITDTPDTAANNLTVDTPTPPAIEPNPVDADTEIDGPATEASPDEPPPISTLPPAVETDPAPTIPSLPEANPLDRLPTNGSPITTPAGDSTTSKPSKLSNLDSLRSEMGELSELLEQSGTSILKIQDLAEANKEQQLIGIPKYFIKQPEFERLDFAKQLALGCGGFRYNDARLSDVLREITSITGVPITLDTDSMLAHLESEGGDVLNPMVSIDVKDVDFGAVIDALIGPKGLTKSIKGNESLIIHASSNAGFVERKHRLPNFPQADEQAGQQFVAAVQGLFSPQSWVQEQDPATIELDGNQITVNNTILVHRQIEDFIAQIQAAIDLTENPENLEAQKALQTKWNAVAERLQQPTGLQKSTDVLLTDLLNKILQKSNVTVLIDWERLMPMGWTPATKVPGHIEEESVGEVLKQLARSMNVTIRAIDPTTLELTTFEKAAQTVDTEVYHLGRVLAGPLNEQQTIWLITETLGAQLQAPQVRWVYEPKCQCLILLAPQSLQRQIDSVIKQLEKLK